MSSLVCFLFCKIIPGLGFEDTGKKLKILVTTVPSSSNLSLCNKKEQYIFPKLSVVKKKLLCYICGRNLKLSGIKTGQLSFMDLQTQQPVATLVVVFGQVVFNVLVTKSSLVHKQVNCFRKYILIM